MIRVRLPFVPIKRGRMRSKTRIQVRPCQRKTDYVLTPPTMHVMQISFVLPQVCYPQLTPYLCYLCAYAHTYHPIPQSQIIAVIIGGFFIGYFLLPRLFRSSEDDSALPPLHRVRDTPAVQFSPSGDVFIVEGKAKQLLSGAIHYFRVVPDYWEDRLNKLKAAGLNTVETYVHLAE